MIEIIVIVQTLFIIKIGGIACNKKLAIHQLVICIVVIIKKITAGYFNFLSPEVGKINSYGVRFTNTILLTY